MIISSDMLSFKNGVCYVDVGALPSKTVNKIIKQIKLGEFGLQIFASKIELEEIEKIQ